MSRELETARALVKMLGEKESSLTEAVPVIDQYELGTLKPGEVFKIAEYGFIVLKQHEGITEVISKGLMAENEKFDANTKDYGKSSLKKLIEEKIQPIIEGAVGAENLVEQSVSLTSVDMQKEFDFVTCKVRPITFGEARTFNDLLVNKDLPDWYWTCTPWSTAERGCEYSIAVVSPSGDFNGRDYYDSIGVRPFCILKSNIFVSKGEA